MLPYEMIDALIGFTMVATLKNLEENRIKR